MPVPRGREAAVGAELRRCGVTVQTPRCPTLCRNPSAGVEGLAGGPELLVPDGKDVGGGGKEPHKAFASSLLGS